MKYIYENKQYSSLDKVFKELLEKCPYTIIICKKCEGKGVIQYSETNWRNGNEYVYSEKCETCNGTGKGDKKLNPIFEKKCFSFLNDITFIIKNKQFTLLELKLPENKNLIKTVKNNKIIATTQKTFKPNLQARYER